MSRLKPAEPAGLDPVRRLTRDDVIVIIAQRYRTQERNRQDALDRLIALIRRAALPPTPRRPTKPTAAAKARPAVANCFSLFSCPARSMFAGTVAWR